MRMERYASWDLGHRHMGVLGDGVGTDCVSKEFRVFNSRTRIVEEILHIRFSENTPNNVGSGPDWLFDIDALTKIMNYQPVVTGTQSNGNADVGFKPSNDVGKKVNEVPRQENKCKDQEEKDSVNSTNRDNVVSLTVNAASNKVNDVGSKWIFRNKLYERGIVIRNKARLVAQGYTQEEGIDYDEVFAPVLRIKAIRLFLDYASFKNFMVYQMDVKSAFLYEKIEEEELCTSFEKLMHDKFQMSSMGELTSSWNCKDEGIFISQDKYVAEILKKFGFFEVKTASKPMETQKPLLKDKDGEEVDVHIYRSMIGSLMYLTSLRPDIMFVVCACARYQVNPKVSQLHVVKKIFRYLKGQPKLSLWYPKDSPFDLMAYTDSDYAGASLDRKSTIGGCQFFRISKEKCYGNVASKRIGVNAGDSTFIQTFLDKQLDGLPTHKENYDVSFHTKKVFANMKITGEGSTQPTDTQHTPIFDMPPPKPKKTQKPRQSKRKTAKVPQLSESTDIATDKAVYKEGVTVWCQNTMRDTSAHTRKVKKLEKKYVSRTHKLKRLYKVGLTARVISSSDDEALDKEDTYKQGRIDEVDANEDIALVSKHDDVSTQGNIVQDESIEDVGKEKVVEVVTTAKMLIDTVVDAAQVTTAIVDIPISVAEITTAPTITAESTNTNVEVTQASKRKEVMIQEPEETTTTKIASLQQPQVQDKGKEKAKLIKEPEMLKKRKHQFRAKEELDVKLQAKIDEENRIAI
nr:retrotransposon protein, putative, unclassified [Tanacetum cinerariifolium]